MTLFGIRWNSTPIVRMAYRDVILSSSPLNANSTLAAVGTFSKLDLMNSIMLSSLDPLLAV